MSCLACDHPCYGMAESNRDNEVVYEKINNPNFYKYACVDHRQPYYPYVSYTTNFGSPGRRLNMIEQFDFSGNTRDFTPSYQGYLANGKLVQQKPIILTYPLGRYLKC